MVRLFLLGGLAVAVAAGAATFQVWRQGNADEQRPADAIVVLGAAQYDGRPSPVFEARLEHAVSLWKAGLAKAFIVTGGKLPGDRTTEAAVAREYAIANGVPAEAIFGEDEAHNTLASLATVAAEMERRGMSSAVFVSDPTHMLRVLRIADDLGIDAYGSPTTTSPVAQDPVRRAQATVHELGALAVYFLTGGTQQVELPGG
ncbi:MAG TPA: YdcF family protein [Candidatus Limnocylindrales bacterium]|nr:YdcF family protein [Candidatus Limnocylindrales bacterium]